MFIVYGLFVDEILAQQTCPDMNLGTHLDYNNVISYGTLRDSWKNQNDKKLNTIRENRETDYFYLKYPD